ncbi:MAG TPA: YraN family protein [Desulfonatronum sp.]|nr:YraN family protein [Desulfonatronum sp.]
MSAGHLNRGRAGEDAAVRFLEKSGYVVLERNWRCKAGEVDIICLHRETVVFVEVRTRAEPAMVSPAQSVNRAKVIRLFKAASRFLSLRQWWEKPCRFDLIAVVDTGQGARLEHITDAFEFPQAVGRCHAPWQPW